MSQEYRDSVMRPVRGTRWFRSRCRIELHDGVISATNMKGQTTHFPLQDNSDRAPTAYFFALVDPEGHSINMLLDGYKEAFLVMDADLWDTDEYHHLVEAARLEHPHEVWTSWYWAELPRRRDDCAELFDVTWPGPVARWSLLCATVAVALGQSDIVPVQFAVIAGAASLATFGATSWVTGLSRPARPARGIVKTRNWLKNERAREKNRAERRKRRRG